MSSRRSGAILRTVLGWSLVGAACEPASDPRAADAPVTLDGSQWLVSSLNGQPTIAGSRLTLNFTDQGVGGYSGCNWYGARSTVTGNAIRIDAPESTARGCLSPPGIQEQEATFYRLLRDVATYRVADDRLELRTGTGDVILILTPRPRAAMNPADLAGTRWRLRSVNDSTRPSDSLLTLDLTATGIAGFAGCRNYVGTYGARGDEIFVTSITMNATECARGNAALLREGQFTTDLSEASLYRLRGDSLELVTVGGRRLVFSARRGG